MSERSYTTVDEFVIRLDRYLSILFESPSQTERPYPAHGIEASTLDSFERRHSEGLMRVNHAGEVSAQALYKAQAITVRNEEIRETMRRSANEEVDHLYWCKYRLDELDGRTSYLGPFWFMGSFAIGIAVGIIGDKWNLGFVVETEDLVIKHLEDHLQDLPKQDDRSRAILEQMKVDEEHHATVALHTGATRLPLSVRRIMQLMSRVMTTTAYRI
jgi:ubiquinone biosynthesis monooxygenase Coq7